MALPTITQTWTISPNNRYTFLTASTLANVTSNYLLSIKNFLKTTMGYTVKGSCDGTTGAMDGVDRWSTAANAATRNNGAGGAQSWFVLTDGAGVDICLSFNAATDDIYRIAHSPGGNYVTAATANQQPTATDECFDAVSGTWVNATTSGDRCWHLWGSSDKKMWRAAIWRIEAFVSAVGVEKLTSALISPATFSLANGGGTAAVYKFYYNTFGYAISSNVNSTYAAAAAGGVSRVHTSSDINATLGGMTEYPYQGRTDIVPWTVDKPELQGGTGQTIVTIGMASATANAQGKLGVKIDWWVPFAGGLTVPGTADTYGNLNFLALGSQTMWPWDGVTLPFYY